MRHTFFQSLIYELITILFQCPNRAVTENVRFRARFKLKLLWKKWPRRQTCSLTMARHEWWGFVMERKERGLGRDPEMTGPRSVDVANRSVVGKTQQAWQMLGQSRADVVDVGPAWAQQRANAPCLLGTPF